MRRCNCVLHVWITKERLRCFVCINIWRTWCSPCVEVLMHTHRGTTNGKKRVVVIWGERGSSIVLDRLSGMQLCRLRALANSHECIDLKPCATPQSNFLKWDFTSFPWSKRRFVTLKSRRWLYTLLPASKTGLLNTPTYPRLYLLSMSFFVSVISFWWIVIEHGKIEC